MKPQNISKSSICSINRNPADLNMPEVGNGYMIRELARKPKLMKKAQEEVRRCFGNKGNISERDTNELQYVKMIVKDTTLHPPAPMIIPRENMAHFKIQDYDIDSKTLVFVNG
ncbi:hypothetical protein L3X38_002997 [Prunus dulcis]|uniref:Uncharacterized protein n=1 Tax=Prunus dulcis TaxID=3755 RepID=A0AAD4ZLE5_PRUDU|nr:hypothetical protein L3X38_002997 [Prunus dulcis]